MPRDREHLRGGEAERRPLRALKPAEGAFRVRGMPFGGDQDARDPRRRHEPEIEQQQIQLGPQRGRGPLAPGGESASERKGPDPLRMPDRKLLRDHPAHGDAEHVRGRRARRFDHRRGVVGEVLHAVGEPAAPRLAGADVVEDQYVEVPRQQLRETVPGARGEAEAHDEEHRRSRRVADRLEVDLVPAPVNQRHEARPARRASLGPAPADRARRPRRRAARPRSGRGS